MTEDIQALAADFEKNPEVMPEKERLRLLRGLIPHLNELTLQNDALKAAKARYFDLYELAPLAYLTCDANGRIQEANRAACALLGLIREELNEQPIARFIAEDNRESCDFLLQNLFETGQGHVCELKMHGKDQAPFWARIEAIRASEAEGTQICRIQLSDISERKQTENVLAFLAQTSRGGQIEPFFKALARYLAESLAMDFVCIDILEEQERTARTLVVFLDGRFEENFRYALKDSPCGELTKKSICCYPSAVREAYPENALLAKVGAESFIGTSLWNHEGQPIGLIAAIGRKALLHRQMAEATLMMVGVRAAGELEHQKADEALKKDETRLRRLLDETPYPLVVTDIAAGRVLYINQPGADLFEVNRQTVIGANTEEFYTTPALRLQMLAMLREKGSLKDYELLMQTATKRPFYAEISVALSNFGEKEAALIAIADISLRKESQQALRESEARYRRLFEGAPIGILSIRSDGSITDLNEALLKIMDSPSMDSTKAINVLNYPPLVQAGLAQDFRQCMEQRRNMLAERPYLSKWGKKSHLRYHLTPILTADGDCEGVQVLVEDFSAVKSAEREKERLTHQLQQAMKMEAIGRLAGGVAHDFNNLLTGIMGHISLAVMDLGPNDPLRETLAEVNKAAESAASLTRQLLAFSRKQLIEPKVLDLNEIIASLQRMLGRLIGENIELSTTLCRHLKAVRVDPGQFEQILVNLAVNARDAMPNGGKLSIETANVELDQPSALQTPAGNYVLLSVKDTGSGMSEEIKKHLFEPFFTTKPKGHGTGLGLATIYGAVKQSNGHIEIESGEGEGTTFRIYLPQVEEKAERLLRDDHTLQMTGGSETILLVEDEGIVRELAVRLLKRLGYNVLHAPDGGQAFLLAESYTKRIDLLMTDVVMPGMNGHQLAERLLKIHPEMLVLYTSGYTEDVIVNQGVVDANVNFIGKPYPLHALAKKLREVLASRSD